MAETDLGRLIILPYESRNLPLMWSLDCLVMKVLIQIDLHL